MQLPRGRRRPIRQSCTDEGRLVDAHLSDPILVKRARGGACRDLANRQRARGCEPLLEDRRAATEADPAGEADRAERRGELNRYLAEIAPGQARVLVLRDVFGLSFDEVAAVAGMRVGTAKCYAHRGRNRLREKLSRVA